MKFVSIGTEMFHADGQTESRKDGKTTDKTETIIAFSKTVKSA